MTFIIIFSAFVFIGILIYVFYGLPKNQGLISIAITIIIAIVFFLLNQKNPEIPTPDSLKEFSGFEKVISSVEVDEKLDVCYTCSGVSLVRNDSIFIIPSMVHNELGIDERDLAKFDFDKTFYVELNPSATKDNRQPYGFIWGIKKGKRNPVDTFRQRHNDFVSIYYWNYLLLIPIGFSLYHKRNNYWVKNLFAVSSLIALELIRFLYFLY